LCSGLMVSPSATMTSMTSTSLKSPMSGTSTATTPPCAGAACWAGACPAGACPACGWAGSASLPASGWASPCPPSTGSTSTSADPCDTLSPTLTLIDLTTPPAEAGISIEALSDSTVIKLCSGLIVSPSDTRTSMTSTSLKSPMSGTVIVIVSLIDVPSGVVGVGFLGVDAVLLDGLGHLGRGHGAFVGQRLQRGDRHEATVHFEVLAQLGAVVRPAEAVGAQHAVGAALGDERTDLVGKQLHVIGRRHDRAFRLGQQLGNVGYLRLLVLGMQQIVALAVQAIAAQFGKAGH